MSKSAFLMFFAMIVVFTSTPCFCEDDLSRKLLDSVRNAEQTQRGLATVFRVRSFTVGVQIILH